MGIDCGVSLYVEDGLGTTIGSQRPCVMLDLFVPEGQSVSFFATFDDPDGFRLRT